MTEQKKIEKTKKALKENADRVLASLKSINKKKLNSNDKRTELDKLLTQIYEFEARAKKEYIKVLFVWDDQLLYNWDYNEQIEYFRLKQGFYNNILHTNPNTIGNTTAWVYGKYFLFKEYLENELNKLPINEIGISGFNCKLPESTIEGIHQQMTEQKYIDAELDSFKAIFGKGAVNEFIPVRWLIQTPKKKANKTALFVFLKRMLGKASNKNIEKAKVFFVDSEGNGIEIKTYPNSDAQNAVGIFETIIGLPPLPDQKTKS